MSTTLTASPSSSVVMDTSAEVNLARPLVHTSSQVHTDAPASVKNPIVTSFNGVVYTLPAVGSESQKTMIFVSSPWVLPEPLGKIFDRNSSLLYLNPALLPSYEVDVDSFKIFVPDRLQGVYRRVSQCCKAGNFDGAVEVVRKFDYDYEQVKDDLQEMEQGEVITVEGWMKYCDIFKNVFEPLCRLACEAGRPDQFSISRADTGFLVLGVGSLTYAIYHDDAAALVMWAKDRDLSVEWF